MKWNFDKIYRVIIFAMLKSMRLFLTIVLAYYFKQRITTFPIYKNKLVLLVASLKISGYSLNITWGSVTF